MRAVKFAIAIPQFVADGEFDPAAYLNYFRRAEELGFDSAWAQENMLGAAPQLGPLESMTYAAACTERMRLGCVVFVSTLHSPVHLAKSLATLDQLSRGRIDVGVGTGGKVRPFAAFGVDPDRYLARFTEGIALMKARWTEPRVTFDGEFWQLRARRRINEEMEQLYGRRSADIEAAVVAGTPADCVAALREVTAAGAELILFTAMFDQAEHAERLAAEVIPQLG